MNQIIEEWDSEPDDETWQDPITEYTCQIIRHGHSKHLCGYVYVPHSHPWFKRGYNESENKEDDDFDNYMDRPEGIIQVHGGLTFSGELTDGANEWAFGFDCAHMNDLSPGMIQYGINTGVYRNWKYVKQECEQMAEQLAALEPKLLTEEISA